MFALGVLKCPVRVSAAFLCNTEVYSVQHNAGTVFLFFFHKPDHSNGLLNGCDLDVHHGFSVRICQQVHKKYSIVHLYCCSGVQMPPKVKSKIKKNSSL